MENEILNGNEIDEILASIQNNDVVEEQPEGDTSGDNIESGTESEETDGKAGNQGGPDSTVVPEAKPPKKAEGETV
jgi:hypothetical protein